MGMKILAVVFILAFIGFTDGRKRTKRNLIQLAEEIRDVTGRNPLKFNGYGCYCGWGGSGTPVDANDECCKRHDDCYGSITNDMPGCDPKFNSYDWDITGKTIDCLDQTPKNSVKKILFQPKSAKNCPRRICECDKNLVECLYKNPYNAENYDLDKNLKCKSTNGNTGM